MRTAALPGFRDFNPPAFAERAFIMQTWRDVARRYGFVEYDGPPLEPLELYTRKSGEEIVGQLYTFTDKGGREIALRPEMTPSFARMVGAKANSLPKPVRWFSIPQLFRYERQQKGRLREHFQLNVDIVGEEDVTADAELLAVALDIMRDFGLTGDDVRARVSDRRLLSALLTEAGVGEAQLPSVYAVIDKLEREPREVSTRRLAEAGVDAATAGRIFEITSATSLDALRAAHAGNRALAGHLDRFARYFGCLDALGVAEYVRLDLSIVRGLAYYTGIVFEIFDARGEFRAICGGGRYDTLLQSLGGVDLPALGFGMGDVVLGELLRARGLMRAPEAVLDYWVAGSDESLLGEVMAVAAGLRRQGASAVYALKPQTLGAQLKAAAKAGARRVVILTAERFADGEATVKTLADGREEAVRLSDWLQHA